MEPASDAGAAQANARGGDLTEAAYLADRQRLRAELASLAPADDWSSALAQTAAFLRDLPAALERASQEQGNALARIVFQSVEIQDHRVVATVPQAAFAPFFNLAEVERDGSGNDEEQPT